MVVDWQLSSYLPDHGGPHGTRYGYGKMVCGCVRACVCGLSAKFTAQRRT